MSEHQENVSAEQLLLEEIPAAPAVTIPDMDVIRGRMVKRRRRKRIITTSLATAAVVAAVAIHRVSDVTDPGFADSSQPADIESFADGATNRTSVQDFQEAVVKKPDAGGPDIVVLPDDVRVFARVRNQLPVFGVSRETQRMQHVGWFESESTIPVNLNRLPARQQQSIRAVLHEGQSSRPHPIQTPHTFSL